MGHEQQIASPEMKDLYEKLAIAEKEIADKQPLLDGKKVLKQLRLKYCKKPAVKDIIKI